MKKNNYFIILIKFIKKIYYYFLYLLKIKYKNLINLKKKNYGIFYKMYLEF